MSERLTRKTLQAYVDDAVSHGRPWIHLRLAGDPNSARQRLLGAKWGPKGWVVAHDYPDNIVRFNAEYVQDYLDTLPLERLGDDDDVTAIAAREYDNDKYVDDRE